MGRSRITPEELAYRESALHAGPKEIGKWFTDFKSGQMLLDGVIQAGESAYGQMLCEYAAAKTKLRLRFPSIKEFQ